MRNSAGPAANRLPKNLVAWVARTMGRGSRIQVVRRLPMGSWHLNHRHRWLPCPCSYTALRLGANRSSCATSATGREDVLEAVVTLLLEGLHKDLDEQLAETWQGYLQTLAHAVRRIAVEHPATFPLVATRHPAAPWLRPPLRSLELVENFLLTCNHGFSDQQVVGAYRTFSSFLLGQLLLESAVRGAETAPVEEPLDEGNAQIPNQDDQRT